MAESQLSSLFGNQLATQQSQTFQTGLRFSNLSQSQRFSVQNLSSRFALEMLNQQTSLLNRSNNIESPRNNSNADRAYFSREDKSARADVSQANKPENTRPVSNTNASSSEASQAKAAENKAEQRNNSEDSDSLEQKNKRFDEALSSVNTAQNAMNTIVELQGFAESNTLEMTQASSYSALLNADEAALMNGDRLPASHLSFENSLLMTAEHEELDSTLIKEPIADVLSKQATVRMESLVSDPNETDLFIGSASASGSDSARGDKLKHSLQAVNQTNLAMGDSAEDMTSMNKRLIDASQTHMPSQTISDASTSKSAESLVASDAISGRQALAQMNGGTANEQVLQKAALSTSLDTHSQASGDLKSDMRVPSNNISALGSAALSQGVYGFQTSSSDQIVAMTGASHALNLQRLSTVKFDVAQNHQQSVQIDLEAQIKQTGDLRQTQSLAAKPMMRALYSSEVSGLQSVHLQSMSASELGKAWLVEQQVRTQQQMYLTGSSGQSLSQTATALPQRSSQRPSQSSGLLHGASQNISPNLSPNSDSAEVSSDLSGAMANLPKTEQGNHSGAPLNTSSDTHSGFIDFTAAEGASEQISEPGNKSINSALSFAEDQVFVQQLYKRLAQQQFTQNAQLVVSLKPSSLGQLDIEFSQSTQSLTLKTESEQVKDFLSHQMSELEDMLSLETPIKQAHVQLKS